MARRNASSPPEGSDALRLARVVRDACVRAALEGYEDAAASGLCHEGAWEAAVSAIRRIDLEALVARESTREDDRRDGA